MNSNQWQFWIDVGGTFTDCIAEDVSGGKFQTKVLSSAVTKGTASLAAQRTLFDCNLDTPVEGFWDSCDIHLLNERGERILRSRILRSSENEIHLADSINGEIGRRYSFEIDARVPSPILGIHQLIKVPLQSPIPPCRVFLGTTRGTNALLTRTGARTALVTSSGLNDFLRIGDQSRQGLFDLVARKSVPLFERTIEIRERVLSDGTIELVPDREEVRRKLLHAKQQGIESLAICLIHSYRYSAHEEIVAEVASELGFEDVRCSSDVAPLIQLILRGETTVLDAYLNPVLAVYLDQVQDCLHPDSDLRLMTSAGALTSRKLFSGKDSVLSGPAGGAVGSARIAQQVGYDKTIGFDMGGTSTDVSRFDGEFQIDYESRKAGVRVMTPVMAIETVAAGGGSVCRFDGIRLLVGPESAGSDPGPACYGAGGPLTVTDINLFMGRLDTKQFPFQLDSDAVLHRLNEVAGQLAKHGIEKDLIQIASGFLQIANNNMAAAIKSVSAARGIDPVEYLMVSFGGAGGQHCCGVADCIGIEKILAHPFCSILSALGIQLSDQSLSNAKSILRPLADIGEPNLLEIAERLKQQIQTDLVDAGVVANHVEYVISVDLRYAGTDYSINVVFERWQLLQQQFHNLHEKRFGYRQDRPIEVVAVRATGTVPGRRLDATKPGKIKSDLCKTEESQEFVFDDQKCKVSFFRWDDLKPGDQIIGPAIVGNSLTSTIIDPGWVANVLAEKQLLIERQAEESFQPDNRQDFRRADPAELEIFNRHFAEIAEQMGQVLQKTAISVNVKQRLDYSCAVFSSDGELVVNAPHIPVHLGAMSETVKATIRLNPGIADGDVFITNDPYSGGSHLPDVTVLTPVFIQSDQPVFWVANRAHHAEIGGIAPGSMPAGATELREEGVIITNLKLIDQGTDRFDELENLLTRSEFPSRSPDENLADVTAQIAANQHGIQCLRRLVARESRTKVEAYMSHIRDAAERKTRSFLQQFPDGVYRFDDVMDDGSVIEASLHIQRDELTIDFTGTAGIHHGNLNANRAIVSSVVMYVLRCLLNEDIPMNSGILKPVTISLPRCFLNPDRVDSHGRSPAVVGGNVETSQRIVDVLFGALNVVAASQGTMNNWLVGDESFGYYETVGGGAGAGPSAAGADAVHCHMSNTRLTDPEILETRYPMILREFAIRNGSGGQGEFNGGNGMVREVEFRRPLTLSLLTSRRTTRPFGLNGGAPGESGRNLLIRASGAAESLPFQCEKTVAAGDRLRILTPGGGGMGPPLD